MKKSLLAVLIVLLSASKSFAHGASEAEGYRLAEATGVLDYIALGLSHILSSPVHILLLIIAVVVIVKSGSVFRSAFTGARVKASFDRKDPDRKDRK